MSEIKVTFLGHTSILIEDHSTQLLLDPNFSKKVSFKKRRDEPVVPTEKLREATAIFYTNPRLNRMDFSSLKYFLQNKTKIYLAKGLAKQIQRYYHFECQEIEQNKIATLQDWTIKPLSSKHFSIRFFQSFGTSLNYIFKNGEKTIGYFSDQKFDSDFFKDIAEKHKLDLAIFPLDFICPKALAHGNFMTIEEIAEAIKILDPKKMLAIAYRSFLPKGQNGDQIFNQLKELLTKNHQENLVDLKSGESLVL